MVESKALERLGIVKPKNPFRRFLSMVGRLIVFFIVAGCVWGGWRLYRGLQSKCSGLWPSSSSRVVCTDDGSFKLLSHIAVDNVAQYDARNSCPRADGEGPVDRMYWHKVSIDSKWYFSKFVPRIKKLMTEIAGNAEIIDVKIPTTELAYSNDGADKLANRGVYSHCEVPGDEAVWSISEIMGISKSNDAMRLREKMWNSAFVLLLDGEERNGGMTLGKLYVLSRPQHDKLNCWIRQNVEGSRGQITASAMMGGKEVGSSRFSFREFEPIGSVASGFGPVTVISHWANVSRGSRCWFFGIHCHDIGGLSEKVDIEIDL